MTNTHVPHSLLEKESIPTLQLKKLPCFTVVAYKNKIYLFFDCTMPL